MYVEILLAVLLVGLSVSVSSCDKAYIATMEKMGYAKRDILSSRVKSARDAQEEAKQEIQTTLEQFEKSSPTREAISKIRTRSSAVSWRRVKIVRRPSKSGFKMSKVSPMRSSQNGNKNSASTPAPTCAGRARQN